MMKPAWSLLFNRRHFFAPALLAALCGLAGCENDLAEVHRFAAQHNVLQERVEQVTILYSDSATVRVRVQSPLMLNFLDAANPHREFPNGITVDFFSPQQTVETKLTAKYALQNGSTNTLFARDSVVVSSLDGTRLETDELIWDSRQQQVRSDKFVKITTPTEVIYGFGFRSDAKMQNWEIYKIQGRFATNRLNF